MFDWFKSKQEKIHNKVNKFIDLQKSLNDINLQIDELAVDFNNNTNNFTKAIEAEKDDFIKSRLEEKFGAFNRQHLKEIGRVKREKDSILKAMKQNFSEDEEFQIVLEEEKLYKAYNVVLSKYRSNEIGLDVCDNILKAKTKKKVEYADNIVYNTKGQILLLKRSENDKTFPGLWVIPGGHVDLGEDCHTAAKRELKEEAGIEVDEVTQVGEYQDSKVYIKYFESYTDKEPCLQQEEIWNYEWVDRDKIKDYEMPLNMNENLQKILFPYKNQIIKLKKALENDLLKPEQYKILLNKILEKSIDWNKRLKALKERRDPEGIEDDEEELEKAWTKHPIGTTVTRKDGKKYKKVSETGNSRQDWKLVTQTKDKQTESNDVSKEGDKSANKEGKQSDEVNLTDAAKNASETALNTAIKESGDPKVREAAHQELDRREKEEKVQEEKEDGELSKEDDKKEVKSDLDSIEGIEKEIKRLRSADSDDFDEFAKQLKQIDELLKKREKLIKNKNSERKVSFSEYRKEFKDFSKMSRKDVNDYYEKEANKSSDYLAINFQENIAANYYTQDGFENIRDYLITGKLDEEESDDPTIINVNNQNIDGVITSLSKFINDNKIKDNLSLNRRVKGNGIKFFKSLNKGDIYEDKSFSSTSLDELESFGQFNIEILAKKGSSVANIANSSEKEYLIDKDSKFRVLDKTDTGIIVELL